MTSFNEATASPEALQRESLAWVNRLLSGSVTDADAEALTAWRSRSPAHEAAFADAVRLQRALRRAVQEERREPAARGGHRRRAPGVDLRRRALIGGSLAASIAAYLAVRPPGALWPSLSAMMSDYRTTTGERRRVAPAPGVSMEMNTQTELNRRASDGLPGVELVSGETDVRSARPAQSPFVLTAGAGRVLLAGGGRINARRDGDQVCITCLEGRAELRHRLGALELTSGRQVVYTPAVLGRPAEANLAAVTGWRRGLLIFRDEPLQEVVDELNRYRRGRIVLTDPALAGRPVYGVFQVDQIDHAVEQVQRLTGAKATRLPGDIVILS